MVDKPLEPYSINLEIAVIFIDESGVNLAMVRLYAMEAKTF